MSTTLAQDDVNIPHWIKNNAGWWADDQITDTDFVKGIQYLMGNAVLQIPTNQQYNEYGVLKLDSFQYELPKRNDAIAASIFGKFSDKQSGSLTIQVTGPDGKITEENTAISKGTTKFNYQYLIKNDFSIGEYQLTIRNVDGNELGPISFTVKVKSAENLPIPFWIKNTAGWWASSSISDKEFVNALQFLVKEDIIKVEEENVELPKGMDPDLLVYRTKLTKVPDVILNNKLIKTEPYTAVVVYSTQNENCSTEEKRNTSDYAKMTEYLLNKFPRPSQPTEVIAVCMELHEIKDNTYPFTLKELGISSPGVVIYVGGLEANLESYNDKSAVGWWSVSCGYLGPKLQCATNQIVVCDECKRWFSLDTDSPIVNPIDFDDAIDRGMWTLAHEIGHLSHWEKVGDGGFYDGSNWVNKYGVSIHDNQRAFDYCYQQDILENALCKKLYEKVKINDRIYTIMNIRYAINNWDGDQEDTLEGIKDLLGSGAQVEGFNRQTYSEAYEKDDEGQHILKPIFSIEYPDDWFTPDYNYGWYSYYGNGTSDPSKQNYEFNHEFPADKVLEKFGVNLWKEQSCVECPQGYEASFLLANTSVFFFENAHSVGKSDEKILDVIEDVEWEWCNSLTINENGAECLDFKLKDKVVHLTDEGRKAYTVVYEYIDYFIDPYEPKNSQIKKVPTVYIASEIYDGNDAWHITTYTDKDIFDKNPDQFYRFLESFRLVDYNTPVSTVTTPKTPEPTPVTPEEPKPTPVTPPETPEFYWGALVELDKVYYTQNDVVNVLITAPNFNTKSNVIEYIGTDANSRVTITTSQGTLDFYKLKEIGVDTGVFEGSISLNSVSTSGTGPWSGKIKTSNQDIITIEFTNTYSGKADTVTTQGFVDYNTPP